MMGHYASEMESPEPQRSSIKEQIVEAKKQVQKLKKAAPYLFPQWNALQEAEQELELAKTRYEIAKKVWEAL